MSKKITNTKYRRSFDLDKTCVSPYHREKEPKAPRLFCFSLLIFLHKYVQNTCTFIHIVQKTCTIVNMENEIGENIKALRKMHGMTQGDLALILGGKKSLVSNYENGYSTPDIYTLIKLADVFDVSLDELVGRK